MNGGEVFWWGIGDGKWGFHGVVFHGVTAKIARGLWWSGERQQQRVHSELGSLEMEVGQRWGLAGDGAWWGVL